MTAAERPDPAALRRLLAALPAGDLPLSASTGDNEWCQEITTPSGNLFVDVYSSESEPAVHRAALIVAAVNALPALLDRLEAAEAALAFYGDPHTYFATWDEPHDQADWTDAPIEHDCDEQGQGARARAALAGAGEGGTHGDD